MGIFGPLFFSEQLAQLEAFKATLTNAEDIAEVDEQIADLKARQAEAESVSDK